MTTENQAPEGGPALAQRITDYLSGGGLFNPEHANHDAVRDLLIECRATMLAAAPAAAPAGWISVTEEMPPKFTEVMIAFAGAALPSTGQYTGNLRDSADGWSYPSENSGDDTDWTVTHWRPLPDHPEAYRFAGSPDAAALAAVQAPAEGDAEDLRIALAQRDIAIEGRDREAAKVKAMRAALDFAAGAIGDAIYTEDGLDGDTGQRVLHIITEARELGTFDQQQFGALDHLCPFTRAEKAEAALSALQPKGMVEMPAGLSRSDAEFWLRKRGEIIDALRSEGLSIVSTAHGMRLMKLGKIDAQAATSNQALAPAHDVDGRAVIERALTKALALEPSDSPATLTYEEAVAYQRGLAAAYQHALEMIPAGAPAPAVAHGWQPIETAPKDGTEIIVSGLNFGDAAKGRHVTMASWRNGYGWWEGLPDPVQEELTANTQLQFLTHWIPLPPAPVFDVPVQGSYS